MKRLFLIVLLNLCLKHVDAQRTPIQNKNAQWLQYYLQAKINEQWSWNSDISLRTTNAFQEWSSQILRTGISYQRGSWFSYASVGYFWGYGQGQLSQREVRLSQDLMHTFSWPKWSMNQRVRIEERLINPVYGARINTFRYRYRWQMNWPIYINKNGKRLNVLVTDEVFLHNKTAHTPIVESNRVQGGLQWQGHKNLVVSAQYVFNLSKKLEPESYEETDIFWLGIIQRLSLKAGH